MTQLEAAKQGQLTEEMRIVAQDEGIEPEELIKWVANGRVVIPANKNHHNRYPYGIGEPLRVKINANIGTSPDNCSIDNELAKLKVVDELNSESVMDLSVAGELNEIRETIIEHARMMVGTVPIYQIIVEHSGDIDRVDIGTILEIIDTHGRQGVDFITVHCGVTRGALPFLKKRTMGIVSRGGSFIVSWMRIHNRENPLYEHYDDILDIARKYDITLSLGDGLRPGAIVDASDEAQFHELRVLGKLTQRARQAGVQVMVEGPGHVPLNQIKHNIQLQQEVCDGAPFYLLGPLTTDVAPGYDHIVGAIGSTLAAYYGAAFLCYITPAEHLRLPTVEDVREGVIASKIAAHSADLAKGNEQAWQWDRWFSEMRYKFDWEGMYNNAIDKRKPRKYRKFSTHVDEEECSMCGEFCALKLQKIGNK